MFAKKRSSEDQDGNEILQALRVALAFTMGNVRKSFYRV
jgi:hypothetical protein